MTKSQSLAPGRWVAFDTFQMDLAGQRLRRGDRDIALRPKSWDVLRYLVERPGMLITKEALHRGIWPEVVVSDDTLTKSISELRQALSDSPRTPRIIETVHGRGFRFVAQVQDIGAGTPDRPADVTVPPAAHPGALDSQFVGRQSELHRLQNCLRRAREGERQVVFISGEAGIGKTTLAEAFLRSPSLRASDVHVLHGQCIQQHGQREPYMPMLEALERVLRTPVGSTLVPLFRQVAPCWHVQIPWLLSEGEPARFQAAMTSAPAERMLREIGTFLETVAARSTVVLVLEDLHWSDTATADLLLFLGQRRDHARLLIIGTFRAAEASAHDHPIREIKQTLRTHGRCVDLALDYLSPADIREYLRSRFGLGIQDLAAPIHRRTDGNPLFVVAIVEELIRRGQLVRGDGGWAMAPTTERLDLLVPEDLLEMVTAQFQALTADERRMLEAASVLGVTFAPSLVARALGHDAEDVDAMSQYMARGHHFLTIVDRVEERGPATRYEFAHALHRQVIYEQIPRLRRQRLHLTIGEALEANAGERLAEIAPELSVHFEQGDDLRRAARYLTMCVARAQQRLAPQEAIAYAELALDLLKRVPDGRERDQQELEVRMLFGVSLNLTRGYRSPAVRDNYERARALCRDEGNARQLFEIVHAVWYAQMVGAKFDAAREAVAELARISEGQTAPEFRLRTELARGRTAFWTGHFEVSVEVVARFLEEAARQPIERSAQTYGITPMLAAYGQGSLALWFIGRPDLARRWSRDGIAYAEAIGEPFGLASTMAHATFLELLCGDVGRAAALATGTAHIAVKNQVATFGPMSRSYVAQSARLRAKSGPACPR
jgi:DNA-binding winged helix-turn-helix (wHTH) protein